MATHQISILNGSVLPDATGRVWAEPVDVTFGINDAWKYMIWALQVPSSIQAHGLYGVFTLPNNYAAGANLVVVWSATATGNVRMRFSYRAVGGDSAESLDQTGSQESVNGTDSASTRLRCMRSFPLTVANFLAGDTVQWFFERYDDGSNLDVNASLIYLHDLLFQYTD